MFTDTQVKKMFGCLRFAFARDFPKAKRKQEAKNGPTMSSHYLPHTKIPTLVFPTSVQASRHLALMIESLIRQNNSAGRPTVLGLATGSTPVGLYRELIRLHKEAGLELSRMVTFNLSAYQPLAPADPPGSPRVMQKPLLNH